MSTVNVILIVVLVNIMRHFFYSSVTVTIKPYYREKRCPSDSPLILICPAYCQ
jgi:hypothetical protein